MKWFHHKLNPFGNADDHGPTDNFFDDPQYADKWWFRNRITRWFWWVFIRNPLHNLCFYWFGTVPGSLIERFLARGMGINIQELYGRTKETRWVLNTEFSIILPLLSFRWGRHKTYLGGRPVSDGRDGQALGAKGVLGWIFWAGVIALIVWAAVM